MLHQLREELHCDVFERERRAVEQLKHVPVFGKTGERSHRRVAEAGVSPPAHVGEPAIGDLATDERSDDLERDFRIRFPGQGGDLLARKPGPGRRNVQAAVASQARHQYIAETKRRRQPARTDVLHVADTNPPLRPVRGPATIFVSLANAGLEKSLAVAATPRKHDRDAGSPQIASAAVANRVRRCYRKAAIAGEVADMKYSEPVAGKAGACALRGFAAAAICALGLASCASSSENRAVVTVPNQDVLPAEFFVAQGYCPPVQIRPGTESFVVHERGQEGNPAFVRYQASITKTARECHPVGPDTLSIKVGVAGRLTAGPKGGAGSATLPLRIVVVKQAGSAVFYSEVFSVPVTVTAPTFAADYSQVIDQVTVKVGSGDRDLIVYVGFDEGPPEPTG
jgi:hypothetical protein